MIEITTATAITYIVVYIIVFIAGIIFMDKYFKYKRKYTMVKMDMETMLMMIQLKDNLENLFGMEEEKPKRKKRRTKKEMEEVPKESEEEKKDEEKEKKS